MGKPVYSFHAQLKKGKKAEEVFAKYFKLDGEGLLDSGVRAYDYVTNSGLKVELKTDYYTSGNFFIEKSYGNSGTETPGAIWQSLSHGVDVFIFWFPNMGELFIFKDLHSTTDYTDAYITSMNLKPIVVQNKGFCGIGYKIPKPALAHLYTKEVLNVPLEELNTSV